VPCRILRNGGPDHARVAKAALQEPKPVIKGTHLDAAQQAHDSQSLPRSSEEGSPGGPYATSDVSSTTADPFAPLTDDDLAPLDAQPDGKSSKFAPRRRRMADSANEDED
jgi:hypothetical protein